MKCNLFPFFFCYSLWGGGGGGISGRVRALNLTVPLGSGRVGSGQTISGTGRVRASVLSPCRPLTHTYWSARDARGDFSICRLTKWGHKYMNNIPRTARRVTSRAFDGFIWVKRSSYHIYIGYRNLKGPHGNLSKYKFGLAEYITVYVIQLQQLLQLLLRIITQYAEYVYFKFYKMFTECFWVISVLMLLLIFLILLFF